MALPAYRPLVPTMSEIRVLTLQPSSKPGAPIHCSLSHVSLDASPSFEALSYVWGATTPQQTIILDGNPFGVSPSLQAALRALRQRKKPRTVWVEAICINQTDDGEKGYQVPLMGRLYAEATRTLIWFGEANPDIDALVSWLKAHGPDRKLPFGQSSTWLKLGARKLFSEKASREKDLLLLHAANGFFDILRMRYWYRMWTFQEFVLPKEDPLYYCGDHEFRMDEIGETKDRILEQVDEVRQRVDAKIAATKLAAAIANNVTFMQDNVEHIASRERTLQAIYLAEVVVFVTEGGLVGKGVANIEVGDTVTVLDKESLPIVLRPGPRGNRAQKLVGTAREDSVMDKKWLDIDLVSGLRSETPAEIRIQ